MFWIPNVASVEMYQLSRPSYFLSSKKQDSKEDTSSQDFQSKKNDHRSIHTNSKNYIYI